MRHLLALASLLFIVSSCTKEGEDTITRQDELRNGKWKMISGTQRWDPAIGLDTVVYYYDSLPTCRKDDYLVFLNGMAGTQNSGEKCDVAEPDAIDFSWYLENNGNTINFYNAFQTFFHQEAVTSPLLNFTGSQFTVKYQNFVKNTVDSFRNDTITHTYTFQKF